MGRKAREAAECALLILLRSALEAGETAGFPIFNICYCIPTNPPVLG